ncbi:MAG: RidA family protein [Bryobacteraceae bacterium]|nr:RidA family protein [Bryobacteraceae bacterium]MDW8379462.1 RidA family protein [Bryobacterales bacterium]
MLMFIRRCLASALILALAANLLLAQRKKKKKEEPEEITQTLELPKDPPMAVVGDSQRLGFVTAPMFSKGLLSQQVRESLKALRSLVRGAQILKIRAFVAGTGDLRRVQAIMSEFFTEARLPIPALTSVQVGALPQEGAQVLLEAITQERKPVNPNGVAFFSGQQVSRKEPLEQVEPLVKESIDRLELAARGVKVDRLEMLRVTCFVSALGDYFAVRRLVASRFPRAALSIVQTLRGLTPALVECEAVGRTSSTPSSPLEFANPEGLQVSPNYSQVAIVNAPKLIFTGAQLAFNNQESDVRLALDRLRKVVEQAGGSLRNAVLTNYYPLTPSTIERIRQIRFEFLNRERPPASTMLLFEGLPSMDASFSVEVIALP